MISTLRRSPAAASRFRPEPEAAAPASPGSAISAATRNRHCLQPHPAAARSSRKSRPHGWRREPPTDWVLELSIAGLAAENVALVGRPPASWERTAVIGRTAGGAVLHRVDKGRQAARPSHFAMELGARFRTYREFKESLCAYQQAHGSHYSLRSCTSVRFHNREHGTAVREDVM